MQAKKDQGMQPGKPKKMARKTGGEFYLLDIRWQWKYLGQQEEEQQVYMNGDDQGI